MSRYRFELAAPGRRRGPAARPGGDADAGAHRRQLPPRAELVRGRRGRWPFPPGGRLPRPATRAGSSASAAARVATALRQRPAADGRLPEQPARTAGSTATSAWSHGVMRIFRKLHEDGRAPLYLTTIAEGNETALKVLTSGRAGLPIVPRRWPLPHDRGRAAATGAALRRSGGSCSAHDNDGRSAGVARSAGDDGAATPVFSVLRARRFSIR